MDTVSQGRTHKCLTAGLPGRLSFTVNVNTELPGSLGKKGYTVPVSYVQLVIKPELLLGRGAVG